MKNCNMILTERLQKYQLPPDQSRLIEQAKCTYSPLGKAFEKQMKTVQDQGKNKLKL